MLNGKRHNRRPLLVELAGPAGVGKSTLAAALARRSQAAQETIWGLPVLPLLANGARMLPTLAGLWRYSRSPLWDESRHMVRLSTLRQGVRENSSRGRLVVFDEGPIFALAWLRGFGHQTMRSQASEKWWRSTLQEWAPVIDAVVVLEAPDSMLAGRIRARPVDHEVKEFADPAIAAWMARFRVALDWVLAELTAEGGPVVIRLSTDQEPAERIADRILKTLRGGPDGD